MSVLPAHLHGAPAILFVEARVAVVIGGREGGETRLRVHGLPCALCVSAIAGHARVGGIDENGSVAQPVDAVQVPKTPAVGAVV